MEKLDTNELMKSVEHLTEATSDDLAQEVYEEKKPEVDSAKMKEEYAFAFKWKDGRGKTWEGPFVNEILTIAKQQAVGVLRAKLGDGLPISSLDPFTNEINLMISHMTFSLKEKPDWAKDLRALHDVSLIQAIYEEVASHEATFFGSTES